MAGSAKERDVTTRVRWVSFIVMLAGIGLGAQGFLPAAPSQVVIRVPPAAPTVSITLPTAAPTFDAGTASSVILAGNAVSLASISSCAYVNSLGGSGNLAGTPNYVWPGTTISLTIGSNVITVSCTDIFGQIGTDVLTVTRSAGGAGTNPISAARQIDWSTAGAGTIPARLTACYTDTGGLDTLATINTQIQSCTVGQTVLLQAGTYNFGSGGAVVMKSGVTLRGAGPNSTFLLWTGGDGSGGGFGGQVCFCGPSEVALAGNGGTTVNWTAGFARGTTQITLSSVAGLAVGEHIYLDQLDDSNTDTGQIWVCATDNICSDEGPGGGADTSREQQQQSRVTNVAGNVVTISPAIRMPNWALAKTPHAWWPSSEITAAGVEELSIEWTSTLAGSGVVFFNAHGNWAKHIRSIDTTNPCGHPCGRRQVLFLHASNNTVRDSYLFGTKNGDSPDATQSYGIECYASSSDDLIENNILQHIPAPVTLNGACSGEVIAYNYMVNNFETQSPTTMSGSIWLHAAGVEFPLIEGNDGAAFFGDTIHGTHHFATIFRNHFNGWETGKTVQTFPFGQNSFGRYYNVLGNILGRTGTHTVYQGAIPATCGDENNIYHLGCSPGLGVADDPKVASTMLRWGNWDVVSGASRFVAGEVPTADPNYPNSLPSDQTLVNSLYLSAKPSWFGTNIWPPIGPDVTGGTVTDAGGHVFRIPARVCFEDTMGGTFGDTTAKAFTCTYP